MNWIWKRSCQSGPSSGADEPYLRAWSAQLGVDALLTRCMDAGYEP